MLKDVAKKFIAITLTMALILPGFNFGAIAYGSTDTEGPVVDLDSLKLSTTKITDPYKAPTVKIKATDVSGIENLDLFFSLVGKSEQAAYAPMEYNKKTGYYEGEISYQATDPEKQISVGYYGDYYLWHVNATDLYYNRTDLDNLGQEYGRFSVVGGNPDDMTAPVVDCGNIVVDSVVEKGKTATMKVPITDESAILEAWVHYESEKHSSFAIFKKKSQNLYETELKFEHAGEYRISSIYAVDANGNATNVYNSDAYRFESAPNEEALVESMAHANIQYGEQTGADEKLTLSIKSMELSSEMIGLNTSNHTLTVTFGASAPLKNAGLSYEIKRGKSSYETSVPVTKVDDYTFRFTLPSKYYGKWYLASIGASDSKGNGAYFYNPAVWENSAGIPADLSAADFYVGIIDAETGLGVSDAAFDKTTKLEVEEENLGGQLFDEMVEDDQLGIGLYDVEVNGTRDDRTTVSFVAPDGFRDGDQVSVVHKRHDGSKETFDAEVKNGRITVETDEFSPFLVQVEKDHNHRYSAKKVLKKATFAKSGQGLKKCYACDATGEKITLKPAKAALSKSRFAYTGKNIASKNLPKVVVKDANGKAINSKYYTVKKPANVKKMKNIGRYAYQITFKKNCEGYTGSKKVYLEITPNKTGIISLQGEKKSLTVKWKKGKAAQVTGYEVMAATNNKFTKNVKTVQMKGYSKVSKKMTKLKAKTKYYVKVRTYKTVKGVKIYSDWSKVRTVKTK